MKARERTRNSISSFFYEKYFFLFFFCGAEKQHKNTNFLLEFLAKIFIFLLSMMKSISSRAR